MTRMIITLSVGMSPCARASTIANWRRGAMAIPARYINAIERGEQLSREAFLADLGDLRRAISWLMRGPVIRSIYTRRRRLHFTAARICIDALEIQAAAGLLPRNQNALLVLQQAVDGLVELTRKTPCAW